MQRAKGKRGPPLRLSNFATSWRILCLRWRDLIVEKHTSANDYKYFINALYFYFLLQDNTRSVIFHLQFCFSFKDINSCIKDTNSSANSKLIYNIPVSSIIYFTLIDFKLMNKSFNWFPIFYININVEFASNERNKCEKSEITTGRKLRILSERIVNERGDEPCREISTRLRFGENMYLNAIFNDLFTEIKQRYECRHDWEECSELRSKRCGRREKREM